MLQGRIVRWMMLVAITSVLVCAAIFNTFLIFHIEEASQQEGDMLAQVTAATLAGRVKKDADFDRLLGNLRKHPKVAFACVLDAEGTLMHSAVWNSDAWLAFIRKQRTALAEGRLEVHKASAINILGSLVLGLSNPQIYRTVWSAHAAQGVALLVVCMGCLPIARWLVNKWTRSLRELLEATRRLASGQAPEPVTLNASDEMGYLASAFNDMAGKLVASHRSLVEANEQVGAEGA